MNDRPAAAKRQFVIGFVATLGCAPSVAPSPLPPPAQPPSPSPPPAPRPAAIATDCAAATEAAVAVLDDGGNAVDAAVAAALVASVVDPGASGLGGSGYALVWESRRQTAWALDFRGRAPARMIDPDPPSPGATVAVPGALAGLYGLHQRGGSRDWSALWQPVIARASEPSKAPPPGLGNRGPVSSKFSAWATRDTHPELVALYRRIAKEGPAALYRGEVATRLAETVREAGGALTEADLDAYRVRTVLPLSLAWRSQQILTLPPSSSGGFTLLRTLRLWPQPDLDFDDAEAIVEFARVVRTARTEAYRQLDDTVTSEQAKAWVDADSAVDPAPHQAQERGTNGIVVVDHEGTAVVLALTLGGAFGARLVTPDGLVLNAELDGFVADDVERPEARDRPRPGARPLSGLAPTVVLDGGGRVLAALTASGGEHAPAAIAQWLLGHRDGRRVFISQFGGLNAPMELTPRLREAGAWVVKMPDPSALQAVFRDAASTPWQVFVDPTKGGAGARREERSAARSLQRDTPKTPPPTKLLRTSPTFDQ